ncbi:glycogen synthase GlgA [Sporomusa aerivorans]|uniref:glycogen synthase GlgA n=1 Tax=Sporomusa aerivorans TaxID=204936 RepID=UPI00352B5EC7
MIKVLFAASEAAPFVKTGGLGDVIASLPKELRRQGVDARVIIPKYGLIADKFTNQFWAKAVFRVPVSWRLQYAGIEQFDHDGVPFYFVDNEYYFKRFGLYGHYDDAERYTFFCRAVLEALPHLGFQPQILHCHDWHTALISVLLNAHYRQNPFYEKIRTLFTIHNLKYQGIFPKDIMINLLDLDWEYFTVHGLEFYDSVNFMKGGLIFSDLISTVSPAYAREIQHAYFGEKLEGVIASRQSDLTGIVNGIDYTTHNPSTDNKLFSNYNWQTKERKAKNKLELQKMLGMTPSADTPLVAMNTRLVEAKGLDLVVRVLDEILESNMQLVILGQGDEHYHHILWHAAWLHPEQMAVIIPYNEDIARKLFAASDLFLMPSRYEPCGIGQLIAMRYGSLPVVRETGGLKDTVRSYNEYTGEGNGFSFTNYNAHDMLYTLRRAANFFQDKTVWNKLVVRAMRADNSWRTPAQKYHELYNRLYIEGHVYKHSAVKANLEHQMDFPLTNSDYQFPAKEALYAH